MGLSSLDVDDRLDELEPGLADGPVINRPRVHGNTVTLTTDDQFDAIMSRTFGPALVAA